MNGKKPHSWYRLYWKGGLLDLISACSLCREITCAGEESSTSQPSVCARTCAGDESSTKRAAGTSASIVNLSATKHTLGQCRTEKEGENKAQENKEQSEEARAPVGIGAILSGTADG
eukprot:3115229-Rhodomonas_salina.1